MKAVVFTESGQEYGYGHFYRCMALAGSFLGRGVATDFYIKGTVPENTDDFFVLEKDWTADNEFIKNTVIGYDFVIIDSYTAYSEIYTIASRNSVCIFLDDYNRISYPEGLVVNGAVSAVRSVYPENFGTEYLLGSRYALLRGEFLDISPKIINENIRNILITLGGTDNHNLIEKILSVATRKFPEACLNVVSNSSGISGNNIFLYNNLSSPEMKRLMSEADLAISAAGQTLNELAVCGVPTLAFKIADNQSENLKGWVESGFIDKETDLISLEADLRGITETKTRELRSLAGQQTIDGKGADRVVKTAFKRRLSGEMIVWEAQADDITDLFHLANDREVRQNSFNSDPIPFDDHKKWLDSIIISDTSYLYIFRISGRFIGQVRFDIKEHETVTGISINSDFRGLGVGKVMLERALEKITDKSITLPVTAYIKENNTASVKIFESAGYKVISRNECIIRMEYGF